MDTLPIELIQYIISLLPSVYKRWFYRTTKNTLKLQKPFEYTRDTLVNELCEVGLVNNVLSIISWADKDYNYALELGVKYSLIPLLDKLYFKSNTIPNDEDIIISKEDDDIIPKEDIIISKEDDIPKDDIDIFIAKYGRTNLLNYARNWNDDCTEIATINGHLDLLKWVLEQHQREQYNDYEEEFNGICLFTFEEYILNVDYDFDYSYILELAFDNDHLHIIKWIVSLGYELEAGDICTAFEKGYMDIIEYTKENNMGWYNISYLLFSAMEYKDTSVLQYILDNTNNTEHIKNDESYCWKTVSNTSKTVPCNIEYLLWFIKNGFNCDTMTQILRDFIANNTISK